jgi:ABC-type multidrug transport system ATPase subunit
VSEPVVRLRGLRKSYGRRLALAGIDLEIDARQILGVVGPDGAGKSTLLRALVGLLEVEADEARVLGHDLRGDVTALKACIGYVPQVFSLHRALTISENLRFTARLHRIPAAEAASRMAELLERTALTPFADREVGALSGGMKQKLAVVNALLPRPQLLVLDEPTAGVDVVARGEIWTLLERAREQALVVLSTSYLDEAANCDRLAYLDEGRVIATGTPDELRSRVLLDLYRAWGDDARAIAAAARDLEYVAGARATGPCARVEVRRDRSPGSDRVLLDLAALRDGAVRLVEHVPVDMETTLLGLAGVQA